MSVMLDNLCLLEIKNLKDSALAMYCGECLDLL